MVTVAVAQFAPKFGDKPANIDKGAELIQAAARAGADLVVLPELASTGYMFANRAEALGLSELRGVGSAENAWTEAARDLAVHVVAGFNERAEDGQGQIRLYNSAMLIRPDGQTSYFRKVHLWDEENIWFTPGDMGFPVYQTALGKIGMMICYDGWFSESCRSLALGGAELVCVPTNWVPIPGQREGAVAMANLLIQSAAHSNGLSVAACNRVGVERGQLFIGQSLIVSHTGWPVAGPASDSAEELLVGELDLEQQARDRAWGAFNHVLRDRRPDQYRQ